MKQFADESTTVGLWHFEETSGATQGDSSGNAYDLTDNANAPTRITTTDFGGGLSFNGTDDYTERSGGGANLEATSITVELLLFKPSPHSGDVDFVAAYEPRGSSFDGRGWRVIFLSTGILRFDVGFGTGAYHPAADSGPFPLDRWVYVAGSFDSSTVKLYRCGTLITASADAGTISYAASPSAGATTFKTFVLGAEQQNDAVYRNFGKCYVADLRVSNIAKSDAAIYNEQLNQQYCEVEPQASPGTMAYGTDSMYPQGAYHKYKTIRAAVEMMNNLTLGP